MFTKRRKGDNGDRDRKKELKGTEENCERLKMTKEDLPTVEGVKME